MTVWSLIQGTGQKLPNVRKVNDYPLLENMGHIDDPLVNFVTFRSYCQVPGKRLPNRQKAFPIIIFFGSFDDTETRELSGKE